MKAHPLVILLSVFGLAAFMVVVGALSADHAFYHREVAAAEPHSPAEFPSVFAFDPLEGLAADGESIHVPPAPLSEDYWPCSDCHDPEDDPESVNPVRRELTEEHEDIVLHHDEEHRWCLDCHDLEHRDSLHLAGGALISFEESYKLCGQCHGTIYRDWKKGIHGKRTGYYDGPKRYLLCVHCHWPHAPRFKKLRPLPPPVRPEFLRPSDRGRRGGSKAGGEQDGRDAPEDAGRPGEDVR